MNIAHLDFAIDLAQRAGDILLGIRERGLNPESIRTKLGHFDIVTEADVASERFILSELRSAYPTYGIISEETNQRFSDAEWVWIVDPLDGTTNYSHGLPIYGVNIALAHNGYPVLGVTYEPANNRTYWAVRDRGAWARSQREYGNGETRLHVSEVNELKRAILATGFQYARTDAGRARHTEFAILDNQTQSVRRLGAASMTMVWVAAGNLEAYWETRAEAVGLRAGLGDDRGGRRAPDRLHRPAGEAHDDDADHEQRSAGDRPGDHANGGRRGSPAGGRRRSIRSGRGAGLMYIDRRYRGRKRRVARGRSSSCSRIILIPGVYLLATRTRFFENPFNPLAPTATPDPLGGELPCRGRGRIRGRAVGEGCGELRDDAQPRAGELPDALPDGVAVDPARAPGEGRAAGAEGRRRRAERGKPVDPGDGAGLERPVRRGDQELR